MHVALAIIRICREFQTRRAGYLRLIPSVDLIAYLPDDCQM